MNPQIRFVKTDKGHDEIKNRTHKLEARTRQMLVMVDGGKAAGDLLTLGGGIELLQSLIKDGFIREAAEGEQAAAAPAAGPMTDEQRQKLYAAKASMRSYIKMASIEVKTLGKLVDEIKSPADLAPAMAQIKSVFDANGFAEAFANLAKEVAATGL